MDPDWASQRLLEIRTLMERSAIYRRALAPIMLYLGILGLAGSVAGALLQFYTPVSFGLYWVVLSGLGILGAYFLARRQSMKDKEEFWSPPTKRVTQALLPPLLVGAVLGVMMILAEPDEKIFSWAVPVTWMLLYGCAVHAAGFFMPRGMKLLGWIFILGACSILLSSLSVSARLPIQMGHVIMGIFFGGLHLLYGIYLFVTDKPGRET